MFSDKIYIMDGATGTQLQKAGMPAGACSEQWVLENPDKFIAIQRAYADAGSDLVYAPTFGANSVNLKKHGVSESVEEMCGKLVALSREAVGGRALVVGDMSSTGLLLDPYGETEEEELLGVFAEQARALEFAGVDLYGVETQMYLDEARLAVKAIRDLSDRPIIVSFTLGPTGKTLWGEDICDVADELSGFGLAAFGVNCVGDLELVRKTVERLHASIDLPIIAKPNAGMPKMVDGKQVYDLPPEALAEYAVKFADAGASLIGGCCGTDERHIAAIRAAVSGRKAGR